MTFKPRVAPHGRSIILDMPLGDSGIPEILLGQADAGQLAARLRELSLPFAAFLEDSPEPFRLDEANEGLILRKGLDNLLTVCSLYPREKATGKSTVEVYLPPALALRLSIALRAWATGQAAPRVRARNAPGAKAPTEE